MRTFTCKTEGCGYSVEANSPSALIGHAREAHGRGNGGPRGERTTRSARRTNEPTGPDKEASLLSTCVAAFNAAGTDQHQDARVLKYLSERFGPEAYADAAEDAAEE